MNSKKLLLYLMSFLIIFSSVIHPSVLMADTVDDDIEASDLDFNELTAEEELELESESTFEVFSEQQTSEDIIEEELVEEESTQVEEPVILNQEDEITEEPVVEESNQNEDPSLTNEDEVTEEDLGTEEELDEEEGLEEEPVEELEMGILNVTGGPGAYFPDEGTLSLNVTLEGVSTNAHSKPVRLWTQNGLVHIAVKATHNLDNMTVRGVGTNMLHKYGAGEHITIDGQSYNPADGLQGNTKDAHFTIFTIDRASLGDINDPNFTFYITGIGGGHDVGGTFIVDIPSVSATVYKTWIDGPMTPVTVDLLRDGVVIDTIVLSVDNPSYYWDSLLYTDAVGDIYDYTIRESDPGEGYTVDFQSSYDSGNLAYTFTLTNTYTSPVTDITVQKIWNDENNNDGKRPDSVEFQLLRNGESYGEPVTMVADNGWSHTFSGLPVTDTNGNPYTYTVIEVNVPDGYTSEVNGLEITNSYTPERINIEGTKIWNDGDNQDGKRPDEITVHLMVGEEIIETLTVTADDDWSYEFTNLLKYNEGIEIDYHVSEVVPDDYTVTYNGFDIKNSYTPEKTNISVQKIWDDMDNNDGVRPESIEVQLLADDVEIGTATLNADNNWSFEFKNLPVYRDGGIEIAYTVAELDMPDGYTSEVDGFEITNTRAPETIDIPVVKIWDDMDNNDGVRPSSIDVRLLADDVEVQEATLTAENNWTYEFTDLLVYRDGGTEIVYSIEELNIPNEYTSEINGFEITNSYTPERIDIEGMKTWYDSDNQDGNRPDEISVQLMMGDEVVETLTVTADDDWAYEFTNLLKFNNGVEVEYHITEVLPEGYSVTYDGYDITNSYTPEETSVTATKYWDDNENQDGVRPESVFFQLNADGNPVGDAIEISEDTDWRYTWTGLPVYDDGTEIDYTVVELSDDDNVYEVSVTEVEDNQFVVTNSYTPETMEIPVTKIWNDAGNQDGIRPDAITVNLLADGDVLRTARLDEDKNWSHLFEDLPVNRDGGIEIDYSIEEVNVPEGYTSVIDGFEITNSYTPEIMKIPVKKIWDDMDNNDGLRPAAIEVQLLADEVEKDIMTLNADNNWSSYFRGLPVYRDGGIEIEYSIVELNVPDEYTPEIDGFKIKNSYTPERINVEGTKTWDDSDNQDGNRPEEITVNLMVGDEVIESINVTADDEWSYEFTNLLKFNDGNEIDYRITEVIPEGYSVTYDGYEITNSYTPEETSVTATKYWYDNDDQDGVRPASVLFQLNADGNPVGEPIEVSDEIDWRYTWTGLPVYDNGTEIVYTVEELSDEDNMYEVNISEVEENQYVVKNSYTPEKVEIPVTKIWDDMDNNDGVRPASIDVRLLADDVEITTTTLNADNDWSFLFTDLPKYRDGGIEIDYSIEEFNAPDEYTSEINGFEITNSYTPERINIEGTKSWDDSDNQDGNRPDEITVRLMVGEEVIETIIVTAEDDWSYEFTNLLKFNDGVEIEYRIYEVAPEDYTVTYDGHDITNSYTPEETSVTAVKYWEDNDDQDGVRALSVNFQLLADGNAVGDPIEVSDETDWRYTWVGLPVYDDGTEIVYTVEELSDDDNVYDVNVTEVEDNQFVVTNSYTPETIEIPVTKVWNDNNNQDGVRPASIEVELLADDVVIHTVTLNADNDWAFEFTDLPVYRDGGTEIEYTIEELNIPNEYTSENDGFEITNSYTPESINIPVKKFWDDLDNNDGVRPLSIEVQLLADGVEKGTALLDSINDWSYEFRNLPVYRDGGIEIEYTIEELNVPEGYTSEIEGFEITNSYPPERINIEGTKTWDDGGNQDGNRPDEITVRLMMGDEVIETLIVTAADDWSYEFTDLYKFYDGHEVEYRVVEEVPEDYTVTYDGFDITNSYTPEETGVTASKHWEDNNDQDGVRPEFVLFQLYADEVPVGEPVEVSVETEWRYTWIELPVYDDGTEIVYTVEELSDNDNVYEVNITEVEDNQFVVTNSYTPETMEIPVTKIWDDMDNNDGERPASIDVRLLADEVEITTTTLNAGNNWSFEFTDLPVYRDGGTEIEYSIEELNVPEGYTSDINGFEITNIYEPERVSIKGTKSWDDGDNQDGNRPDEITVQLMVGEEVIEKRTVTADDDWSYEFTNLLKFNNGIELDYRIYEVVPEDYTVTYDGFDITNSYTPEETGVTASKHWDDNDNQDGNRSEFVLFQLIADGNPVGEPVRLDETTEWRHTWTGLPVNSDGNEIEYSVEEILDVDDAYDETVTEVIDNVFVITNSNSSETMVLPITKVWNDGDDQDGIRPTEITLTLLADNESIQTATLNADMDWTFEFTDLPVYRDGGIEIEYSIREANVPEGYTATVDGFEITNSHTPELFIIPVTKVWDDMDNNDGMRPDEITVQLFGDGVETRTATLTADNDWTYEFTDLPVYNQGEEIIYTVVEVTVPDGYTSVVDGFEITNSYTPETVDVPVIKVWDDGDNQDGNRPEDVQVQLLADGNSVGEVVHLSTVNNWTHVFEALPVYDNGVEIVYSVEEVIVDDVYEVSITQSDGYQVITNTYVPETVDIAGTKVWDDGNNQDGNRQDEITVNLMVGEEIVDTLVVTSEDDWQYAFVDLPKFEDGIEIDYRVVEIGIDDYTTTYDGYDITNSYTPEETGKTVVKVWDDGNNQDGNRPDAVFIQLFADGIEIGEPIELTEAESWRHTWTGLPVMNDGTEIVYTVEELSDDMYDVTVTDEDGEFIVVNSYTPQTKDIEGVKIWDDSDNADNMRPTSISVNLHANGEIIETIEVTENDDWSYAFYDLAVYNDGAEINYTISENSVDHYVATYDGFDIINTYVKDHTGVTVTKVWKDYLNKYDTRSEYVEIQLLQNGVEYGEPVRLSGDNDWEYGFTDLPMYVDGEPAVYSVIELTELEGYKSKIYGEELGYFTVVNILVDKPEVPEKPEPPEKPETPEEPEEPVTPEELPQTGIANENALMALLIVVFGMSGLALLFRRRFTI